MTNKGIKIVKGDTSKKLIALLFILSTLALIMLSTQIAYGYGAVTCTGYVRDTDGNPIVGATVTLYGGLEPAVDTTDSNGYYCVGAMAPSGPYLKVKKTNYVPQTRSVSYNGGTYNFNLKGLWAIIVAGETEERFTRDALGMYNTLVNYYGYTSGHIYLLTPRSTIDGQSVPFDELEVTTTVDEIVTNQGSNARTDRLFYYPPPPPPPPTPEPEVSREKFEWATDQVAAQACSGDQVFIYWTGHGNTDIFAACDDTITATQFDDYLDDIDCGEMFIFLGPCHSGSFINNLDDEANRAIYTSCTATQSGYLSSGSTHSLFPWAVYRGLNPTLNADDADTNNNYRVSLHELFDYCVDFVDDNTSYSQDPQRWVGSQLNDDYLYVGDQYY